MRAFRATRQSGSPADYGPAGARASSPAVPVPASGPRPRAFRGPLALLVLFAVSGLLTAAGAAALVLTARLDGSPAAANRALTDSAVTRQVAAAVSAGVTEIYSYSYTDLAATQRAARRVLTGRAAAQYQELLPALHGAVSQRLTVVTRVTRTGVISLAAGSARLLLFLDQTVTRGDGKPNAPVTAQLTVTARLSGGTWLITSIQTG